MKSNLSLKSRIRSCVFLAASGLLLYIPLPSLAQCAAAPIAAATCSGGNGAATSGTNINSGNTYWFSGGPSTFSGINLNSGGTFRVCGNLTLSGMSYNGGTLIVESGGKLTINTSLILSGTTIINRGSLIINGSMTLQGSNNYLYNELSTSVLTISGTVTLNGTTSFIINRGLVTANTLYIQGITGAVCLQDNSIMNLVELDNNYTNSITYSGAGAPSCLNVSTKAVLNNDVSGSAKVLVCTNATPSGGASADASHGWGLASVTTGCSSCATLLSLPDLSLSAAMQQQQVLLQWTTAGDPSGNDVFFIERSVTGMNFSTIASQQARAGTDSYTFADFDITSTEQFYRVRWMNPAIAVSQYSPVVKVATGIGKPFRVYPNPVEPGQVIHILLPAADGGKVELALIDPAGRTVSTRTVIRTAGDNPISWGLQGLTTGIYIIRVTTSRGGSLYYHLAISGTARK
jgi:hypothetical protein